MRPAIEAGLMLFAEALEAYMRQLLRFPLKVKTLISIQARIAPEANGEGAFRALPVVDETIAELLD